MMSRKKDSDKSSQSGKIEVKINVYDLLRQYRPGISSILWGMGTSILHTGVVVNDLEYAFGGSDVPGTTGVYTTKPKPKIQGVQFRCEILQGHTLKSPDEVQAIIKKAANSFPATSYNLLYKNCNHFTSHLCQALTGKPAPRWINRAAGIGTSLPCLIPRSMRQPPDHETAEGDLVDDVSEDEVIDPFANDGTERGWSSQGRRDSADLDPFADSTRSFKESSQSSQGRQDNANLDSFADSMRATKGSNGSGREEPGVSAGTGFRRKKFQRSDRSVTRSGNSLKDTSGREIPGSQRAPDKSRVGL